jgi:phosphotriesterase-related protein
MTSNSSAGDLVQVETVLGPVPLDSIGMTLMHEHIFDDLREAVRPATQPFLRENANRPVSAANAWALREDPYTSPDNCMLDDLDATCEELALFAAAGGRTVVDNTTGIGRDPAALRDVARRTGLNLVMGGGWCLAHGHDSSFAARDPEDAAQELIEEIEQGTPLDDGSRVRPGIIGEIGVGPQFTDSERVTLLASAIAQTRTGLPLLIHLPGWQRRAHEVVDLLLAQGCDPSAVVLCHMDPSGSDPAYQREVAVRGVWLEFDMIGMPYNFPGEGQSPAVHETADAVANLIHDGLAGQLLLSHDVFLKGMWTRHGGNGYSFVPQAFLPRLVGLGVDPDVASGLLTRNPAALFANAARTLSAAV